MSVRNALVALQPLSETTNQSVSIQAGGDGCATMMVAAEWEGKASSLLPLPLMTAATDGGRGAGRPQLQPKWQGEGVGAEWPWPKVAEGRGEIAQGEDEGSQAWLWPQFGPKWWGGEGSSHGPAWPEVAEGRRGLALALAQALAQSSRAEGAVDPDLDSDLARSSGGGELGRIPGPDQGWRGVHRPLALPTILDRQFASTL